MMTFLIKFSIKKILLFGLNLIFKFYAALSTCMNWVPTSELELAESEKKLLKCKLIIDNKHDNQLNQFLNYDL